MPYWASPSGNKPAAANCNETSAIGSFITYNTGLMPYHALCQNIASAIIHIVDYHIKASPFIKDIRNVTCQRIVSGSMVKLRSCRLGHKIALPVIGIKERHTAIHLPECPDYGPTYSVKASGNEHPQFREMHHQVTLPTGNRPYSLWPRGKLSRTVFLHPSFQIIVSHGGIC